MKKIIDSSRASEGKEILVGIVSMLMGLLDTFGGMVSEEQAPYGGLAEG